MVTVLHPLITYEMCGTHTGPFEVVLQDPEARPRGTHALVGGPSLGVIQTWVQSPNLSLISLVIWGKWGKIETIRPTSRAAGGAGVTRHVACAQAIPSHTSPTQTPTPNPSLTSSSVFPKKDPEPRCPLFLFLRLFSPQLERDEQI